MRASRAVVGLRPSSFAKQSARRHRRPESAWAYRPRLPQTPRVRDHRAHHRVIVHHKKSCGGSARRTTTSTSLMARAPSLCSHRSATSGRPHSAHPLGASDVLCFQARLGKEILGADLSVRACRAQPDSVFPVEQAHRARAQAGARDVKMEGLGWASGSQIGRTGAAALPSPAPT